MPSMHSYGRRSGRSPEPAVRSWTPKPIRAENPLARHRRRRYLATAVLTLIALGSVLLISVAMVAATIDYITLPTS